MSFTKKEGKMKLKDAIDALEARKYKPMLISFELDKTAWNKVVT